MVPVSAWTVFWAALITALANGLGAVPFFFMRQFSRRWIGIFNALASGMMLGASMGLIHEGIDSNLGLLILGTVAGLFVILLLNRSLQGSTFAAEDSRVIGGIRGFLIVGVMTIHSFAEGIGIGVAYGGNATLGAFITAAIAIHNIPEGLAVSLVQVPRGIKPLRSALWSIFTALPQPLMAVPAFLFVLSFRPFLPFGLGLAAGAMLWMVFSELLPEALQEADHNTVGVVVTLAWVFMIVLQALL